MQYTTGKWFKNLQIKKLSSTESMVQFFVQTNPKVSHHNMTQDNIVTMGHLCKSSTPLN